MVEGVDEREGGGAIEGSAVVEGSGDADRGLVDIGDAEVDFSHVDESPRSCGVVWVGDSWMEEEGGGSVTETSCQH